MQKVSFNNKLENNNILLERIKPEHKEEMFRIIDNDRKILRPWLNWVDKMATIDDFSNYVQDRVNWWETKDMFTYVVREKLDKNKTSNIIGMISFKEIDWDNKTGAFVLWLSSQYRGKKISKDMYELVSEEAFNKGFECVESHIDSRNSPSIKSVKNLNKFEYIETKEGEQDHIDPSINIKWQIYKYKNSRT